MEFYAWTDGASRGNPGKAAAGGIIKDADGQVIDTISEPLGVQTNNYAEYKALFLTLQAAIRLGIKNITVRLDSKLVVEQVKGNGTVVCIEGNTASDTKGDQRNGGQVCRKVRAYKVKNRGKLQPSLPVFIVGFGRPKFKECKCSTKTKQSQSLQPTQEQEQPQSQLSISPTHRAL